MNSRHRTIARDHTVALAFCLVLLAGHAAPARATPAPAAPAAPTAPAAPPPSYSAAGLYNLANAYARAGQPGLAVLNYERARLLAPSDPDIETNLRFVRNGARLPSTLPTAFERVASLASPQTLSWTGLFGLLLVGASLLAGKYVSRYRWLRRTGAVVGIALIGLTVCNGVVLWPLLHEAVVLKAATPVLVSPVPMGETAFVLPEAETVSMTDEHEGFVLVQTHTGRSGWVSNANVAPVVPVTRP